LPTVRLPGIGFELRSVPLDVDGANMRSDLRILISDSG
jgi:hypothetical protein